MKTSYSFSFYIETIKIALQSIYNHKLRTFLTLIGIIIGVASVVVVGASINGLNAYVVETLTKVLGANHFMIARVASSGRITEEQWRAMDKRNKRLEWDDYEWLSIHCSSCKEVGAQVVSSSDLKRGTEEIYGTRINGCTANMVEIENKTIVEGRFLLPHEIEHSSNTCVIGYEVKEKLFAGEDAIGKVLKIQEIPFEVVGVEEKRGSLFGQSFDNQLYIPITTYGKIFGRRQSIQLHGVSENREEFSLAIEEARSLMRNRHKLKSDEDDDFGIINIEEMSSQVDQFTGSIALVVTPITLISLIVGGIVVMNIMLVSVTERTFEIGLRKALGAKRQHILLQFLIESSLLSAFGGLFGLLLASFIAWSVKLATSIPMVITLPYVIMSLIVSGSVGMIFGIYPAYKASKLDPIKALMGAK